MNFSAAWDVTDVTQGPVYAAAVEERPAGQHTRSDGFGIAEFVDYCRLSGLPVDSAVYA